MTSQAPPLASCNQCGIARTCDLQRRWAHGTKNWPLKVEGEENNVNPRKRQAHKQNGLKSMRTTLECPEAGRVSGKAYFGIQGIIQRREKGIEKYPSDTKAWMWELSTLRTYRSGLRKLYQVQWARPHWTMTQALDAQITTELHNGSSPSVVQAPATFHI